MPRGPRLKTEKWSVRIRRAVSWAIITHIFILSQNSLICLGKNPKLATEKGV